jgi:hypothetical protein
VADYVALGQTSGIDYVHAVPEPAGIMLLGLGAVALAVSRRSAAGRLAGVRKRSSGCTSRLPW